MYQHCQCTLPQRAQVKTAIQIHHNESKCYPESEVERESVCSTPWSISPSVLEATRPGYCGVLEATKSGCCDLRLLMCNLFLTALASRSCLTNCLLYHFQSIMGICFLLMHGLPLLSAVNLLSSLLWNTARLQIITVLMTSFYIVL